jgi:hypothetical protein
MGTFLLVLMIVLLLVAAMSVGVMLGRKPISGSCGGLGAMGISKSCDICGGNPQKCEDENDRVSDQGRSADDLTYDASKSGRR